MLEPTVLLENDHVLVLNKPAGVVVNRARSVKQTTLQDWVESYFDGNLAWKAQHDADETFRERSGMVHRIDKDTSGIIVFAKTADAMYELMRQFKAREVSKTYVALVHGKLPTPEGIVRASIRRHTQSREKFTVAEDGRPSETAYKTLKNYSSINRQELLLLNKNSTSPVRALEKELKVYEGGFSLIELMPKTGRTHQIRVHMQFLHHPLVGDERYVGRRKARLDALWCARQFLHAQAISFVLPGTDGERVEVEAPLAEDLVASLSLLE